MEVKMVYYKEYEKYKKYLQSLNLSHLEYEKRLREWCEKHGI